ncbi:AAA-like domain-containing protein [Alkalinema pantanalense CENA528]|uniref:AAA-like domain-containing protein n=1 Tax=Alkalinema pantanalense TaxID=1620705 RepID=UPI003D6EAF2A
MQRAIARHEAGEARVIPIILKPVDWAGAPFGKLQAFPTNAKPVTTWSNRDQAWTNIAQGIRHAAVEMAEILRDRRLPPEKPAATTVAPSQVDREQWETPEGQVPIESRFYIPSAYEERCAVEMQKPGSLIRIKSPHHMGKSSLMARVLAAGQALGYRTVSLNLEQANQRQFEDVEKFMQWFCASVGKPLGVRVRLEDYWDDIFGANDNCTDYFENYLLKGAESPLVVAIDNFDRIFRYQDIETDFCGLLRGGYERSRSQPLWGLLRLMIVYSQEPYLQKDINQSPFNVGLPIELGEFTAAQVQQLVQLHGLAWTGAEVAQVMELIGGHPYLVRSLLYHVAVGDVTLAAWERSAATEAGIYGGYLSGHLKALEDHPVLAEAMRSVVLAEEPVRLRSEDAFKLDSMGLVVRVDNDVKPRCQLYRLYFRDRLGG